MIVIDQLRNGISSMLHPGSETKQSWSIGETLKFYYLFSVIPIVLATAINLAYPNPALQSLLPSSFLAFLIVGSMLVNWLIVIPVILLIDALFIQFFGRTLLKRFANGYGYTFNALVYGTLPVIALAWVGMLPIATLGLIVLLMAAVWGFIVQVYALSNQQDVSRASALGVMILAGIAIGAILMIFNAAFPAASLSSATTTVPFNVSYLAIQNTQIPNYTSYVYTPVNLTALTSALQAYAYSYDLSPAYVANYSYLHQIPLKVFQRVYYYSSSQLANATLTSLDRNNVTSFARASAPSYANVQFYNVSNLGSKTYAYSIYPYYSNASGFTTVAFAKQNYFIVVEEACFLPPTNPSCGLNSTYSYASQVAGLIH